MHISTASIARNDEEVELLQALDDAENGIDQAVPYNPDEDDFDSEADEDALLPMHAPGGGRSCAESDRLMLMSEDERRQLRQKKRNMKLYRDDREHAQLLQEKIALKRAAKATAQGFLSRSSKRLLYKSVMLLKTF